jgi:hypothetical protein
MRVMTGSREYWPHPGRFDTQRRAGSNASRSQITRPDKRSRRCAWTGVRLLQRFPDFLEPRQECRESHKLGRILLGGHQDPIEGEVILTPTAGTLVLLSGHVFHRVTPLS